MSGSGRALLAAAVLAAHAPGAGAADTGAPPPAPPPDGAWVQRLRAASATPEAWRRFRDEVRTHILVAAGLWPPFERPALRANVFGRVERDGYTVENVQLETWPGFFLTANLYRPLSPARPSARRPAVLSLHGHWKQGRFTDSDIVSVPARAIGLARLGFVVLSPDMIGYGDLASMPHANDGLDPMAGPGLLGVQLWNNLRAFDFLAGLPDVDPARVGVAGGSGGGLQSILMGAVEERVAAVAAVNMVAAVFQGGCACENAAGLHIGLTNPEIAAAAAPRPLLLVAATGDWTKEAPRQVAGPLGRLFTGLGARDRFRMVQHEGPHNDSRPAREAVAAWFARWLGGAPPADSIPETPFRIESRATLAAIGPEHPLPTGAIDAAGLAAALGRAAHARVRALPPKDAASVMRLGLRYQLGLGPEPPEAVASAPARGATAVLIVADSRAASEATALEGALARGRSDLVVKRLMLAPHAREAPSAGVAEHQEKYPESYFRRPLAWQVRDVLDALDALAARADVREVRVAGLGTAGAAALIARALATSPKLTLTVGPIRPPVDYPEMARLGTFLNVSSLIAPQPVLMDPDEGPEATAAFVGR